MLPFFIISFGGNGERGREKGNETRMQLHHIIVPADLPFNRMGERNIPMVDSPLVEEKGAGGLLSDPLSLLMLYQAEFANIGNEDLRPSQSVNIIPSSLSYTRHDDRETKCEDFFGPARTKHPPYKSQTSKKEPNRKEGMDSISLSQ